MSPVNESELFQPRLIATNGTAQEASIIPVLPPMFIAPRAEPLSSLLNQEETSLTPGTKTPAPNRPAKNRVTRIVR